MSSSLSSRLRISSQHLGSAAAAGPPVAALDDEVPEIGDPVEQVREDEDRVALVHQRIGQQEPRPGDAEPPERLGNNNLPTPLGGIPLDEEPCREGQIAHPADHLPHMPLDAQEMALVPDPMLEDVH